MSGPSRASPLSGGAALRDWLREEGIVTGGFRLPTIETCNDLADAAAGCHMLVMKSREGTGPKKWRDRETAISGALDTLATLLPEWEDEIPLETTRADRNGPLWRRMESEAREVAALLAAVRIAKRILPLNRFAEWIPLEQWPDYAEELALAFVVAIRSTNPDREELRYSNDGPISRFLERIIPEISGETPRGETIMRRLQRASGVT
jgi:hypothetical protein